MDTNMGTGLAITVLGMAIVFCFIALLALTIYLLSRFKAEMVVAPAERPREIVAVIGAAIHAHRMSSKSLERRGES